MHYVLCFLHQIKMKCMIPYSGIQVCIARTIRQLKLLREYFNRYESGKLSWIQNAESRGRNLEG